LDRPEGRSKAYAVYMAMVADDPIEDAAAVIGRSKRYTTLLTASNVSIQNSQRSLRAIHGDPGRARFRP
jgi:hypothetical protein